MERACQHCGERFEPSRWNAKFCSDACRVRAYRRRRAGLPEAKHAGPRGARRGRYALDGPLTLRELAEAARVAFGRRR